MLPTKHLSSSVFTKGGLLKEILQTKRISSDKAGRRSCCFLLTVSSYRVVFQLMRSGNLCRLVFVWNTFHHHFRQTRGCQIKCFSFMEELSPRMAAAWSEYFSALTSAMSSWTSGRSCRRFRQDERQQHGAAQRSWVQTNLEAAAKTLGFGLDLLGVLQHPLIQNQRLTPLLHQHIRLSYKETPAGEQQKTTFNPDSFDSKYRNNYFSVHCGKNTVLLRVHQY